MSKLKLPQNAVTAATKLRIVNLSERGQGPAILKRFLPWKTGEIASNTVCPKMLERDHYSVQTLLHFCHTVQDCSVHILSFILYSLYIFRKSHLAETELYSGREGATYCCRASPPF